MVAGIDRIEVSVLRPGDTLTLYRVCHIDVELVEAFMSSYTANRPLRGCETRNVVIQKGLSTFVRRAQAEAVARRFPAIGDHLARLVLRDGLASRTRVQARGHVTIWAGHYGWSQPSSRRRGSSLMDRHLSAAVATWHLRTRPAT